MCSPKEDSQVSRNDTFWIVFLVVLFSVRVHFFIIILLLVLMAQFVIILRVIQQFQKIFDETVRWVYILPRPTVGNLQ